jgi:CheY-like chemotaxis protein
VVDDIIDTSESFAELLDLWGHQVRTAHSGPAALAMARIFCPEVVILDIGMPGMDGFEVARRLRREHQGRPMLVVALTGYGQESDRQQSQAAGFDHHLVKPVDLAALRELLNQPVA